MAESVLAAVQIGPEQTELREFPLPDVPEDAAILKVEAAGVCGSDVGAYKRLGKGPRIMGHENVGYLAKVGSAFGRRWGVKEGDYVANEEYLSCGHCEFCLQGEFRHCYATDAMNNPEALRFGSTPIDVAPALWGGYSHYMYLPETTVLHKVPSHVPPDQAALALPLGNGVQWGAIETQASPGKAVMIMGPGQQGLGCVLGAKAAGADVVIIAGLTRDAHRLAVAKQLGVDYTIDVEKEDIRERVKELTGGDGVDAVVDTTSARAGDIILLAIDLCRRKGGRIVVQSGPPIMPEFPIEKFARKYITMVPCRGHSYQAVEMALKRISSGKHPLDAMCTHDFDLRDVDLAIKSTGGVGAPNAIHVTVRPWETPANARPGATTAGAARA
jgi:threonine dehydrogenase-like Zn-dependent dehydrogenase